MKTHIVKIDDLWFAGHDGEPVPKSDRRNARAKTYRAAHTAATRLRQKFPNSTVTVEKIES